MPYLKYIKRVHDFCFYMETSLLVTVLNQINKAIHVLRFREESYHR